MASPPETPSLPTPITEAGDVSTTQSPSNTAATPSNGTNAISPTAERENRFVPNKIEKVWIIYQLIAYQAPLQKMKTLEAICEKVAPAARARHIPDQELVREQAQYGLTWRRKYMQGATKANVKYLAGTLKVLVKNVEVAKTESGEIVRDEVDNNPVAAMRPGCTEDGVEHVFDQALLDYKSEAAKKTDSTDDTAVKTIARQKESRLEKKRRLERRKAAYEQVKRDRELAKKHKKEERTAAVRQNLKAQTVTANAVAAGTQIAARDSELMETFLQLYAARNNLTMAPITTPMPTEIPTETLAMDPLLLSTTPQQSTNNSSFAAQQSCENLSSATLDFRSGEHGQDGFPS